MRIDPKCIYSVYSSQVAMYSRGDYLWHYSFVRAQRNLAVTVSGDVVFDDATAKRIYSAVVGDDAFDFKLENTTNWGEQRSPMLRLTTILDHTLTVSDFVYANLRLHHCQLWQT